MWCEWSFDFFKSIGRILSVSVQMKSVRVRAHVLWFELTVINCNCFMSVYDHVFSTLSLAVTQIGAKTSNADFTHSSKVLFWLGWLIKWGNLKFRKRMTNTLTSWTLKFHHSVAHSFPRKCDGMTVIVKKSKHARARTHSHGKLSAVFDWVSNRPLFL